MTEFSLFDGVKMYFCNMLGYRLSTVFTLFVLSATINAFSTDVIRCSTVEVFKRTAINHPDAIIRKQQLESDIQHWISQNKNKRESDIDALITIPVVVHVVYNTAAQNISVAQIQSEIDRLNKDFSNTNTDRLLSSHPFYNLSGSANIEFCLAGIDPNGNVSTGITRTYTTVSDFTDDDKVKSASSGGEDAWDAKQYLNIWVCNLRGNLLGYAQYPSYLTLHPETDGVVIGYKYFGTTGVVAAPYDLGRTATHEIGHWLNLDHIWGDDEALADKCSGSDNVDDTPNQEISSGGCPSGMVTDNCTAASPGIMYQNYMDYTDDACMVMFTKGQVARMTAVLNLSRAAIKTSNKCSGTTGVALQTSGKLKIYPNPVQNYLTIEGLPKTKSRYFTIDMYNILGDKVYSLQITSMDTMIEMANLNTGTYIMTIYNNEFTATQKLSVVK